MQDNHNYNKEKRIIAGLKFLLLLIVIVGVPAFLYLKFGAEVFSKDSADKVVAYLTAHSKQSAILIIGLQIVQVIVSILPGQPIQFASSYMFGIAKGFSLSIIGAIIGASFAFYLAKLLGADMLHILFDKEKVDEYQKKLNSSKGLLIVLLIYLIPGAPKDLVAYVAGISEMKFKSFIILSSIGRSPGMLGSLLLGHFYGEGNYKAIIVLSVVVAIILIICLIFRKQLMNILDKMEESAAE